jgi:hypothetical protein
MRMPPLDGDDILGPAIPPAGAIGRIAGAFTRGPEPVLFIELVCIGGIAVLVGI